MITIANLLAADLNPLARGISTALQAGLDIEVWLDDRATLGDFRDGRICIALVCGLAYTLLHDAGPDRFLPVAAPVLDDERCRDDAVYFSEIVVPAGSAARSLEDLAGARFAYNEEISLSGYRALEHELRNRGSSWSFFGECVRTGSHDASLARLADGTTDVAAIDSQVMLLKKRRDPGFADSVRVVASLGPYPSPLVAIHGGVCGVPPDKLNALLDGLDPDVLAETALRRWLPVDDARYDPIRDVTENLTGLETAFL